MIAIILALCAAASNAVATVLQRRAAREAPDSERFRLSLLLDLAKRPSWLGGIGGLIGGFLFQAAALSQGQLSLVQPLLAAELPLTLILAGRVFHKQLGRRAWLGALSMAVGLAVVLFGLSPQEGTGHASGTGWAVALGIAAVVIIALVVFGRFGHAAGAALLGTAAGLCFGVTAALMKGATVELSQSVAAVFGSWQIYAMVATGILSVFLLQNALQSGTIIAAQPAVTLSDPVAGIALGIVLFNDQVRLGPWLILEIAGVIAILAGSMELARSPALSDETDSKPRA